MEGELSMKSILWCIRGMSAPLQKLVTEDPEVVKGRDRWGDSLLHYAAQYGYLNVVRVLLDAQADPNALNHAGSSPLHKAALGGHNAIAVALLGAGALPHHVNSNGHLPESVCRWSTTRAILTGNDSIMRIKMIEGDMIPLVIGKQGTTIKVIQMKSGTSIERAKEEEGGGKRGGKGAGKFIITGRPEAVERAFTLLEHCLNNNGLLPEGLPPAPQLMSELRKENIIAKTVHFPLDEHPLLIGRGGEKLNSVQKKNKVKVFIPHKASLSTAITIIGQKEEDLTSAVAEMEAILAPKRKNEAMVKESLQVPRKCHSIIIGKSHSRLRELTEKTGVKISVPSPDSLSEIIILRGLPEEITAAIEFIRNLLKEELKEPHQIDVDQDVKIITASTHGETVNTTISLSQVKRKDLLEVSRRTRVEEEEGVTLKVSEENVLVTGPIENVNRMVKRFSGATGAGMRGRGGGKKEEEQVLTPKQQKRQKEEERLKRLREMRKFEEESY